MTKARSNATAEAAKGDLRAGTGTNLSGILAVGSNGDTIVADSSASTGLRWTGTPSASNPILNSAFDVWQRGTTWTYSGGFSNTLQWSADRWNSDRAGGAGAGSYTVTRQTTGDTTNLPFIQYAARVQRTSGNTNTGAIYICQPIETSNSVPFIGKTVTVSFYARAGANYSASSGFLNASLITGTGTDQNYLGTWTGASTAGSLNATLTTTWQRFTFTATTSASATQIVLPFIFTPTGTAGAADYFDLTGVQIDIGNVALPFRRNTGTIQGELAACQRYLPVMAMGANSILMGGPTSTTVTRFNYNFPVTPRVAPTGITVSNNSHFAVYNSAFNASGGPTITYATASTSSATIDATTVAGAPTLVVGSAAWLYGTNASASILFTGCEL